MPELQCLSDLSSHRPKTDVPYLRAQRARADNLSRRQLTVGQCACTGLLLLELVGGDGPPGPRRGRRRRERAAELTNASGRTIARVKTIRDRDPDLFREIFIGNMTPGKAERVLVPVGGLLGVSDPELDVIPAVERHVVRRHVLPIMRLEGGPVQGDPAAGRIGEPAS